MTTLTTKYALPSPDAGEAADGPTQIGALTTKLDTLLSTGTVDISLGTLKVKATPATAPEATSKGYIDARFAIGPSANAPATATDGYVYFGY